MGRVVDQEHILSDVEDIEKYIQQEKNVRIKVMQTAGTDGIFTLYYAPRTDEYVLEYKKPGSKEFETIDSIQTTIDAVKLFYNVQKD